MDHPILRRMEPEALAASTSAGTVLMLLNAGPLHAVITRLSREAQHPLFGSSANLSLSGTKFRVEDIEPELLADALKRRFGIALPLPPPGHIRDLVGGPALTLRRHASLGREP